MYYNRFRYYDCDVGQYLSADPTGLAGGINPYGYVLNPLSWIDPLGLTSECCPPKFGSRNETFRAAKRDARIPMVQQPERINSVRMTDMNGHNILDANHKPIYTREYTYSRPDGSKIIIQEHSAGHTYGPPGTLGNQGPHFNPRSLDPETGNASRNGSIDGMSGHYEFPGGQ